MFCPSFIVTCNATLGFLKRNLQVNWSSFKAKPYEGLVCAKVEYRSSVWDTVQALRIMFHIRLKEHSTMRLNGTCAISTTHLASPTCLKIWVSVPQTNIGLTVGLLAAPFKITWRLLSVNSHGLLHPVMRRTRHSHSESFIPLQSSLSSEYLSFFSRTIFVDLLFSGFSGTICLLPSLASTALQILLKPM